jgi:hypothetical protein
VLATDVEITQASYDSFCIYWLLLEEIGPLVVLLAKEGY